MALIKCPECGKEISDKSEYCVNCGFPIQTSLQKRIICPECGNPVEDGKNICGYCGYEIEKKEEKKPRVLFLAFGVLLVLTVVFFVIGFLQTHNKRYVFYKYHYEECMAGYRDSELHKYSSTYFSSIYGSISDGYLELARKDMTKIVIFIAKSIVFYFLSIASFISSSLILLKKIFPYLKKCKGRKNGFN